MNASFDPSMYVHFCLWLATVMTRFNDRIIVAARTVARAAGELLYWGAENYGIIAT